MNLPSLRHNLHALHCYCGSCPSLTSHHFPPPFFRRTVSHQEPPGHCNDFPVPAVCARWVLAPSCFSLVWRRELVLADAHVVSNIGCHSNTCRKHPGPCSPRSRAFSVALPSIRYFVENVSDEFSSSKNTLDSAARFSAPPVASRRRSISLRGRTAAQTAIRPIFVSGNGQWCA